MSWLVCRELVVCRGLVCRELVVCHGLVVGGGWKQKKLSSRKLVQSNLTYSGTAIARVAHTTVCSSATIIPV